MARGDGASGGPVGPSLSRHKLPANRLSQFSRPAGLAKARTCWPRLRGTPRSFDRDGSEVSLALESREKLGRSPSERRVVSMPSWSSSRSRPSHGTSPAACRRAALDRGGSILGCGAGSAIAARPSTETFRRVRAGEVLRELVLQHQRRVRGEAAGDKCIRCLRPRRFSPEGGVTLCSQLGLSVSTLHNSTDRWNIPTSPAPSRPRSCRPLREGIVLSGRVGASILAARSRGSVGRHVPPLLARQDRGRRITDLAGGPGHRPSLAAVVPSSF